MDSTQAGWGAAISGLVVVGAAAGLIFVGTSDSGNGGEGADGPRTSEVERESPRLPMPSDSDLEGDEGGLAPKGIELPNKELPDEFFPSDRDGAADHDGKPGGDESDSRGGVFGPGQPQMPQLPQLDGIGPTVGEN